MVIREEMDEKAPSIEVYGQGVLFDVPIIDAESIRQGLFGPFSDMAVVLPEAILKGGTLIVFF